MNWPAENCRPDLAITALMMSRKNNSATIGDLKKINHVLTKECPGNKSIMDIIQENIFKHAQAEYNAVVYENEEIQMKNHISKNELKDEDGL